MKTEIKILAVICSLALLSSCGKKPQLTKDTQDNMGTESASQYAQADLDIPEIVFVKSVDYSDVRDTEPLVEYVFYDKNGDVFFTDDSEIASMTYAQILEKYQDGSISDKLTKVKTINDPEPLKKCINDLQAVLNNSEYQIIHPEYGPDVLSQTTWWQGLYYDENHELKSIILLMNDNFGDHVANDTRAGEIVEFLKSNCA